MFSTLVARGQKRCGLLYCSKLIWFKEETTWLCSAEMLRWSGAGDGGGRVRTSRPAAQLHLARDWSGEHQLKQFLLRHYDHTTRPVRAGSTPVKVQISIALYHILDTVGQVLASTAINTC